MRKTMTLEGFKRYYVLLIALFAGWVSIWAECSPGDLLPGGGKR